MSLSRALAAIAVLLAFSTISACTVGPLSASRPDNQLVSGNYDASTAEILAATQVDSVDGRVAQQVRNRLLFAMNGARRRKGGRYRVSLLVSPVTQTLSVQASSLAPTSAQVRVRVDYALIDVASGSVVASGQRQALAAYDRTPQSFANRRSERDAQNRAAIEVAEQLRLAIAQNIAHLKAELWSS